MEYQNDFISFKHFKEMYTILRYLVKNGVSSRLQFPCFKSRSNGPENRVVTDE